MSPTPNYLCRDKADVIPWAETCGQIRPLIEEKDGAAAEGHHLEITDAKLPSATFWATASNRAHDNRR